MRDGERKGGRERRSKRAGTVGNEVEEAGRGGREGGRDRGGEGETAGRREGGKEGGSEREREREREREKETERERERRAARKRRGRSAAHEVKRKKKGDWVQNKTIESYL